MFIWTNTLSLSLQVHYNPITYIRGGDHHVPLEEPRCYFRVFTPLPQQCPLIVRLAYEDRDNIGLENKD